MVHQKVLSSVYRMLQFFARLWQQKGVRVAFLKDRVVYNVHHGIAPHTPYAMHHTPCTMGLCVGVAYSGCVSRQSRASSWKRS